MGKTLLKKFGTRMQNTSTLSFQNEMKAGLLILCAPLVMQYCTNAKIVETMEA